MAQDIEALAHEINVNFTQWKAYTPTVNTGTWTNKFGWFKRVWDEIHVKMYIGPCTNSGSGVYQFGLPNAYPIDNSGTKGSSISTSVSNAENQNTTIGDLLGIAIINNQGNVWYSDGGTCYSSNALVFSYSTTTVCVIGGSGSGANRSCPNGSFSNLASVSAVFQLKFSYPIS